jgi:uncharacterized protein DUF4382
MGRSTPHRIGMALIVMAAGLTLAACETRISANATTNAPVNYSHVFVTVEQVWLNTSATAPPDDPNWIKSTLDTPQTLDLVGLTSGTLKEFASQLPVPAGTYNQARLILSDTGGSLISSAQSAGAKFNNEVDYFDSNGTAQAAPLEVPNAAGGVAVAIKLDVKESTEAILAAVGSAGSNTGTNSSFNTGFNTGSNNGFNSGFDDGSGLDNGLTNPNGTNTNTNTTTNPNTTTDTTSTDTTGLGTVTATAAVVLDANRDISRFTFSGQPGFALNANLTGQDLADVGTIRSQIGLGSLTLDPNSNRPDVQVTAEKPSSDGSRNIPVLSAPVRNDGTFVLYPFPMDDDAPTTYDLVIHGPAIQTIIIKSVPVQSGNPNTAATINLNSPALSLAAATFPVNVATTSPLTARGARIGFYQTLNGSGELPYLIEERTVDPISGVFALDQTLPAGDVAVGTFSSNSTFTLSAVTPVEGSGAYKLAASGALFGDGTFGDTVTVPATVTTTATPFNAPTLSIPTNSLSGTITANITIASPGQFDKGVLVVTHDGAIVGTTPLDSILSQPSGTVTVTVPAGDSTTAFDSGTYLAEAWVWTSSNPSDSFVRVPAGALIDLRQAATGTTTLALD